MSLREVVRVEVDRLDRGGMGSVDAVLGALSPDEVVEWYAGQLVSIIEKKSWFAVNSIINAVDRFCPAEGGKP